MVSLLSNVINTKTPEEKQAALQTLGSLPVANSGKVFQSLLQQMDNGKLSSEIYLELGDAIDSTRSSELISSFKQISSKRSKNDPTAAYAGSLFGGDPERGKRIFFSHESAQCLRCHSYDDMGGNAGPRLNGVASRITRAQILEALINPSARIAPGFGFVTLKLKDGKTMSGVLQAENKDSVILKAGNRQNIAASTDQVEKRTNAASSMPQMTNILTKKEIRDVVSFLSTLKEHK
jgi:putative heme-binding domain-containing protein